MLILTASTLSARPTIEHGFFGRTGGVSTGIYESLNCGVSRLAGEKDHRENVLENRRRVTFVLAGGEKIDLVTLSQVHSANVITVAEAWPFGESPQADAMVTNTPGIALGILTADCAPVLFADAEVGVIGAAHAGWKGAISGVTDSTIAAMEALGARRERIVAAIGPCIVQASYEVGAEFRARFVDESAGNARFFANGARTGHYQFDLEAYVAHRLAVAGVDKVERIGACTYTREADFFSFRRATHRNEADYGREISAIVLR